VAQISLDFLLYPIDTIRQYKIVMANKNTWDIIQYIRRSGGIRSFWAGFRVHMYLIVIRNTIDTTYGFLQYIILNKKMFDRPKKAQISKFLQPQQKIY